MSHYLGLRFRGGERQTLIVIPAQAGIELNLSAITKNASCLR